MRILILLPFFTHGGAEKQASELAYRLLAEGHTVEAWAFVSPQNSNPQKKTLEHNGIQCYELPPFPQVDWKYLNTKPITDYLNPTKIKWAIKWYIGIANFKRQIPRKKFDVIIPFTFPASLAALHLKSKLKASLAIWNHRGGYDDAGITYSKFLINYILKKNPIFVANSNPGRIFLRDKFKLPTEAIKIINNFPPPALLHPKTSLGNKKTCQLIQISNYFPEKDFDTLISAMSKLQDSDISYHLHIAGSFPIPELEQHYHKLIQESGLSNQITHHGRLNEKEIYQLLQKVDIGILSSRSEGCPNCVMEYMQHSLPVVASNIEGIRDLVGETGENFLFHNGDASHLAEKIETLAKNPMLRQDLGNSNHNRIQEISNPEAIFAKWLETISDPDNHK